MYVYIYLKVKKNKIWKSLESSSDLHTDRCRFQKLGLGAILEETIAKIDDIMGIRKDWSDLGEPEPGGDALEFFSGTSSWKLGKHAVIILSEKYDLTKILGIWSFLF